DHGHPRGQEVPDGKGGRATARRQRMRRAAYLTPGRDFATAVELARRAEALGYESVWVTHGLGRDSFLVLAAYGAATTRLGLGVDAPLAVIREYVAVLRGALGAGADFEGRHFRVRWSLALPERPVPPRIHLAALTHKMLELAGEIADGAILWLCPPAYVRDVALPALERGRKRAGKTLSGFEVVAAVPLAVTGDVAGARAALRVELARYLALPFYRA